MLLKLIFSFLSLFIPVKKNTYIFGSWFSEKYGDNPRYFYEYLSRKEGMNVYWFTRDKVIADKITDMGLNVIYGVNLRSMIFHLRAEAVFCNCHQNSDMLGQLLNVRTVVFNLWHGSPIKLIGNDAIISGVGDICVDRSGSLARMMIKKIKSLNTIIGWGGRRYYLASSDSVSSCLKSAFDLNDENIIIGPYPKLRAVHCEHKKNSVKKILFAPTYRGKYNSEFDILTTNGFDFLKIEDWLRVINAKLHIRLHPANSLPDEIVCKISASKNIFLDATEDIYENFHCYDIVITDFSSIYFDALATDKLAILSPMGLNLYLSNDRSLYYSLNEIFPGTLSYNWDELIENYDGYLSLNSKKIQEIKNRFYPYPNDIEPSELLFERVRCILKNQ